MKKLLPLLLTFIGFTAIAQVGIGTDMPNPSSQLEIVANDRGLLIPQVSLLSLTDESTITNGNVESLLVFNTATTNTITPGYYYWYDGSWKRIASSSDASNPNIPDNVVIWNTENQEFVYLNQDGDRVNIDLGEIANENITTLVDNLDGTYTYTSEDKSITTINVPADVIGNINNNGTIYNTIIDLITSNSLDSGISDNGDGTFTYTDAEGNPRVFDANTTNLVDNGDGTYLLTNANGSSLNINTNADSNTYNNTNSGLTAGNVQDALDELASQSDVLVDNGNGTYTHTAVDGTEVIIDANTVSVTEADGVYTFTDAAGNEITSIDTNASASGYDNTNSGLAAGNVQDALDEIQQNLEDTDTGLGNIDLTDNGDGTFTYTDEAGNTTDFDANTTSYINNGDGSYTFTNDNGETMTVTVVNDVVANIQNQGSIYNEILSIIGNETDVLVDNEDGTYTHTAVDGTEVIIDANTVSVTETDGVYIFTDAAGNEITSIDTNASASGYDNTNSGLAAGNVQDALDEIQQNLEDTDTGLGNIDLTDNGDGTFTYTDEAGNTIDFDANTTSYTNNGDGSYTFTNDNGETMTVTVVADVVTDIQNQGDIYNEILSIIGNETDVLVDNGNGTYTHTAVDGTEVIIDANTVSVTETDGVYIFTDAAGNEITSIDTNASASGYDNTNSGLTSTNVQDALDEIQQNLEDTDTGLGNIDLTDNGDGTFSYTDEAGNTIDFDANTTSYTNNGGGSYTFTNDNGETMTVTVVNDVVTNIQNQGSIYDEILSIIGNETDILVDNEDGTYTHTAVDGTEIIVDANTTSVAVVDGVYIFTDAAGNEITSIDTNASASGYDNTNSGLTSTNVQDALDEIQQNLEDTDTGLGNIDLTDNGDGTFTYTDEAGNTTDFDANTTSYINNGDGSYTFTNDNGETMTVTVVNDVVANIQNQGSIYNEILSIIGNETDVLVDNEDGTYTHTAVDGTEVIIDANTVSVTEADGVYTFADGNGDTITSIDTNASASGYDNTNSGLAAGNVQDALDEIQQNLEDTDTGLGNIDLSDNGDGTFTYTDEAGNTTDFDANTTSYTNNGDGSYTFTNDNGETMTVTVVADVVTDIQNQGDIYNEIINIIGAETDVLVDNLNGTYTHTAVDGTEVIIDANTVSVTETDGVYTFTDAAGNEITSIDTNASASGYDNTDSGLTAGNVQDALDEIQQNLEDTNTDLGNIDLTDNGDGTFTYTDEAGNTTDFDANTTSYTDNGGGSYTFTNDNGETMNVTVVDDVVADIQNQGDIYNEILSIIGNETDVLVDNLDGTYTHTAVDGTEVIIDANTVSVTETDGVYTFTNAAGNTITSIDTNADAIAFDNTNNDFTSTNVQAALEELLTELETGFGNLTIKDNEDGSFSLLGSDGTTVLGTVTKSNISDNTDGSYTFTNNDGADVEFDVKTVDVSFNATSNEYEFKDSEGNVIGSIDMNANNVAFDNTNNNFVATDVQAALEEIQNNLDNTTDKLVDNNNGTYTHTAVDGTEVLIDANTVSVSETDGVYTFTDAAENTITSIDTNASASGYDNTNSGLAAGNVQDALDELSSNLADGAGVTLKENNDGTFSLKSENGDDLGTISKANLADAGDGSYTFDNGSGSPIEFDVKTVDVSFNATNNEYEFKDSEGNVIGSIDMNADNVAFDNTTNGFAASNVQSAIEEVQGNIDNADSGSITSDDLNVQGGDNSTFKDVSLEIAQGAVTNQKLADNAVTESKIEDGSITSSKIQNGEVKEVDIDADAVSTDKIQNRAVSAEKLGATGIPSGQVPIADGSGNVTYGNVSSANVNGEDFTSNDLTITGGTGATLNAVTAEITDGAVDTDALGADAVTNEKLADNAVNTENITDGTIGTSDLGATSVTANKLNSGNATSGQVATADGSGNVTYGNVSSANVNGEDFTSNDLTITGGTGATLKAVTAEITDGAVDTDALSADAVTNEKLADNAVNTENITDGTIGTSDLGATSVTANKLNSGNATSGQVATADGSGNVTYSNVSSANVNGEDLSVSEGIEFTGGTNGTGKLLAAAGIGLADGGITTQKLAADAVTNEKLADNAVNTENITDGTIGTSDLGATSVTSDKLNSGSATSGQVATADGSGNVSYGNVSAANVDGNDFTSNDLTITGGTGATLTAVTAEIADGAVDTDALAPDAITSEKIKNGEIKTGDIADKNITAEKLNAGNGDEGRIGVANSSGTVTYQSLEDAVVDNQQTTTVVGEDNVTVTPNIQGNNTEYSVGVKAAMPKFFYMPSVVFDTSTQGTGFTRDLHQDYVDQFSSPVVSSSGASGAIPTLGANELEYYITYYDDTVFENVSIDATGNLTYDVISSTNSAASFMNIVFVVK